MNVLEKMGTCFSMTYTVLMCDVHTVCTGCIMTYTLLYNMGHDLYSVYCFLVYIFYTGLYHDVHNIIHVMYRLYHYVHNITVCTHYVQVVCFRTQYYTRYVQVVL